MFIRINSRHFSKSMYWDTVSLHLNLTRCSCKIADSSTRPPVRMPFPPRLPQGLSVHLQWCWYSIMMLVLVEEKVESVNFWQIYSTVAGEFSHVNIGSVRDPETNYWYSDLLINIWKMFNLGTDDLAVKPNIPHKSLLQWFCSNALRDNIGVITFDPWGFGGC